MAFATANGKRIVKGVIAMPRVGLWMADVKVDDDQGIVGPCTLVFEGGLTLVGTVARGGPWVTTTFLRVLPGAGGLGKLAKAKHYRGVTVSVVLRDLLATAGERLAASSSATVLRSQLQAWAQVQQGIGYAIGALVADRRRPAASWRALPDGTIWVGEETWPDSGLTAPGDLQELAEDPHVGTVELGIETPSLLPGQTLGRRRVSLVEYRIDGDALRATAWLEG